MKLPLVIVHPSFPWDNSALIGSQVREEALELCEAVLVRAARLISTRRVIPFVVESEDVKGKEVDYSAYSDSIAGLLRGIRTAAKVHLLGETVLSPGCAVRSLVRAPEFQQVASRGTRVRIAGFWRDRCCKNVCNELYRAGYYPVLERNLSENCWT